MKHSLKLTSSQTDQLYQSIKRRLSNRNLLLTAYVEVVDVLPVPIHELSISTIDEHVDFIRSRGAGPEDTLVLFDIGSYLVRHRLLSVGEFTDIVNQVINSHSRGPGLLAIRENGGWEVEWVIDSNTTLSIPKCELGVGEVVPEPMVEILQTAFLCLQSGSNLAALSLALVALETALWDHLSTKGITKAQEIEVFPYEVIADLAWDGTRFHLQLLDHTGAPRIPPTTGRVRFEITRTSQMKRNTHRVLKIVIDDGFSDWMSNPDDSTIERKETAGLAIALARARRAGLIQVWDRHLDEAFRVLRNNLIHQSTDSENVELDTPFGTVRLGEFTERPDLVLFFVRRIVQYVSDAYSDFCLANLP